MTRLIRTRNGWTYPTPPPCCGAGFMQGWRFCRCETAEGGGHPMWRCKTCTSEQVPDCVGPIAVSNDYGGASGKPRT